MFEQLTIDDLSSRGGDLVAYLVGRREDQWFDRTSARTSARHLADLLIGFANAEGGMIVVGVHAGRVEGVRRAGKLANAWRQAARDFTLPPVRHRVETIACTNDEGEEDELILLEVEASEHVHENARGETYLRVGDETRRLGVVEAHELRFDKGQSVFDNTAAPAASMEDLDDELIARYLRKIHSGGKDDALHARGLLTGGRNRRPTIAGLLLFGHQPQRFLPETELRLLLYRGDSRESGARSNVVRDRRLDGPLPRQVEIARRTLRRWLPSVVRLGSTGRFGPSTLIPQSAWLEAVVNAVVHRSYSFGGDHIRVEVFTDRLEVESPGRLPGLVRLDNIRSTRFARNPRIARAMNDLGFGRELGEGVDRMFREMQLVGLPDPIITQGPASVRVTLLADQLAGRILRSLPVGSERFVEHLTRTERVTTRQATELFGVSKPTALGYLHQLVDLGLVEHVGTSPKDPRGYWRLRRGGEIG